MPPESATWSDRGLTVRLVGTRFGDLRWFERCASTNTVALEAARAGTPEGLVIVSDEQSAGRGRLGRRWESPPGASLLVSVLLRPSVAPQRVVMATALALRDAVERVADVHADLKWPNDLVVGDRKLAGVLAESDGRAVVVGAGCNVNWVELPDDLAATATACNLEAGRPVDRGELLVAFLRNLDQAVEMAAGSGVELLERYRARLATLGRSVRVERPGGDVVGVARDVDADGALLVDAPGGALTVHAGDVVHLRSA